jgi:hypothetical protein
MNSRCRIQFVPPREWGWWLRCAMKYSAVTAIVLSLFWTIFLMTTGYVPIGKSGLSRFLDGFFGGIWMAMVILIFRFLLFHRDPRMYIKFSVADFDRAILRFILITLIWFRLGMLYYLGAVSIVCPLIDLCNGDDFIWCIRTSCYFICFAAVTYVTFSLCIAIQGYSEFNSKPLSPIKSLPPIDPLSPP